MSTGMMHAEPAINATTQVFTGSTILRRVIVQTSAAATASIYDNTSTTGTPIFTTPASPAVGTIYEIAVPIKIGIRVVAAAASSQIVLVYD